MFATNSRGPGSNDDAVYSGICIIAKVSTISEASIVELKSISAIIVAIATVAEGLFPYDRNGC